MKRILLKAGLCLMLSGCFSAEHEHVSGILYRTTNFGGGRGDEIGRVVFRETDEGVKVNVRVSGLTPGEHGFHVHQNPSCAPLVKEGKIEKAGQAGGHYDPEKTGLHAGPNGNGHAGDLYPLQADERGYVETDFMLPGMKAAAFRDRSVIIHEGGDNFSDLPLPSGGGGGRIACGIIK